MGTTHSSVLFLGLQGAGKTSIIRFAEAGFKAVKDVEIKPTIGHEVTHIKLKDMKVDFTAWDVSGNEKFHDLWKKYYKECDTVVFVIDSTGDDDYLEKVEDILNAALQHLDLKDAIWLIAMNKQDLPNARSPQEIADVLKLDKLMGKKRTWKMQSTCATTGLGLKDGLAWLAGEAKKLKQKEKSQQKK